MRCPPQAHNPTPRGEPEVRQLRVPLDLLTSAERRDLANALLRAAWSAVLEETRILLLDLLVESTTRCSARRRDPRSARRRECHPCLPVARSFPVAGCGRPRRCQPRFGVASLDSRAFPARGLPARERTRDHSRQLMALPGETLYSG